MFNVLLLHYLLNFNTYSIERCARAPFRSTHVHFNLHFNSNRRAISLFLCIVRVYFYSNIAFIEMRILIDARKRNSVLNFQLFRMELLHFI